VNLKNGIGVVIDDIRSNEMKSEVQALIDRGNVTVAEIKELRCNSAEWEALVPMLDDGAFRHMLAHVLANCMVRRSRPCTTYEEALVNVYAPELERRLTESQMKLKGLVNELVVLREHCLSTYMGGYSDKLDIEVFQHGMETVCNVVEAIIRAARQ
jgi:hypothetical protein